MKVEFRIICSIAALFILTNCSKGAQNNFTQKTKKASIINGTPVTADQVLAKSVVGLMMNGEFDGRDNFWIQGCTGTVLNKNFILTAAHCVKGQNSSDLAVNFSLNSVTFKEQLNPATRITDIENKFTIRKVKSFAIHPLYDGSGSHDVALILLDGETPADSVPVQILPDQYVDLANNKTTFDLQNIEVILMGFGLISEDPSTDTEILRVTTVPAVFNEQFVITDQTKGTGGCNGDSGGPAFFIFENVTYQVGITHGPRAGSTTCHEQGEWVNPALNKNFLADAQAALLAEK
jgi:hypothetical protein